MGSGDERGGAAVWLRAPRHSRGTGVPGRLARRPPREASVQRSVPSQHRRRQKGAGAGAVTRPQSLLEDDRAHGFPFLGPKRRRARLLRATDGGGQPALMLGRAPLARGRAGPPAKTCSRWSPSAPPRLPTRLWIISVSQAGTRLGGSEPWGPGRPHWTHTRTQCDTATMAPRWELWRGGGEDGKRSVSTWVRRKGR